MDGQDGIQRLIKAEEEAQNIISRARQAKNDRLRQAKLEAEQEVASYKSEREEALRRADSIGSQNAGAQFERLNRQAEADIGKVHATAGQMKEKVANELYEVRWGMERALC